MYCTCHVSYSDKEEDEVPKKDIEKEKFQNFV